MIKTLTTEAKLKGSRIYTGTSGFYAWLDLDMESLVAIDSFFVELNLTKKEILDLHCTVMYSKEDVGAPEAIENIVYPNFRQKVAAVNVDWWEGHDKEGYLVLQLDPTDLVSLHDKWKLLGAQPTFDEYKPHVTMRTGISEPEQGRLFSAYYSAKLTKYPFSVSLVREQIEDIT